MGCFFEHVWLEDTFGWLGEGFWTETDGTEGIEGTNGI